jgi:hypothetical protein
VLDHEYRFSNLEIVTGIILRDAIKTYQKWRCECWAAAARLPKPPTRWGISELATRDRSTIERAFAFVTAPASAHASAEPIAALLDRDHMICHQARLSAASRQICRMVRVLARVACPRLHSVAPNLVWLAIIEAVMAARLQARGLRGDPWRPRLHSSARHCSALTVK